MLDLAVRGSLVEQNPTDEPASELLKRVAAEKMRLTKTRKTRSYKRPVSRRLDETPYPLPDGWIWTRIVEWGVTNPRNHFPDKQPASFIPMRMIPAEYGIPICMGERPWGEIKRGYTHIAEGDAGLAKITPCFEFCFFAI